mmetsp:Transcript_23999/g.34371  ORF Transcript_23999/g.34371 Transcript_23999/m.34371 type:complete len:81 (-) Transcript_23999:838-1080(-)
MEYFHNELPPKIRVKILPPQKHINSSKETCNRSLNHNYVMGAGDDALDSAENRISLLHSGVKKTPPSHLEGGDTDATYPA